MRDKSQNDLESIFERHYLLRENDVGAIVANKLASKPVEQVINVIVQMIQIGTDIGQALIDRVASEGKLGQLITAIHDKGEQVPAEVAHAIETAGEDEIEPFDDTETDEKSGFEREEELSFDKPRYSDIEDEDAPEDIPNYRVDPSMR